MLNQYLNYIDLSPVFKYKLLFFQTIFVAFCLKDLLQAGDPARPGSCGYSRRCHCSAGTFPEGWEALQRVSPYQHSSSESKGLQNKTPVS